MDILVHLDKMDRMIQELKMKCGKRIYRIQNMNFPPKDR